MGTVDISWDLTLDFTNIRDVKIIAPDRTYTITSERFIEALLYAISMTPGAIMTEHLNVDD